ncbi:MAG: hypothetical protein ACTHV2_10925 [Brachybacterium sp.]|uniref:hypothetical protein n=1 Tax=Brachybacterium sp. TaxID=1891286 RepID=UPI002655A6BB|nr:hypothetical protein [Brevibacterium sp.]MDN6303034.1 hypothetical protein [Brachybacterium sp.]MDN6330499.1 hypothetical protein [Brachybacterium sp.]MDN6374303.1 hypothetical protein [Brevibacterium aurantiacum]
MVYTVSSVIAVIAFIGGMVGQRKIVASGPLPATLTVLEVLSRHSSEYTIPNGTATIAVFGWLAGVLTWAILDRKRKGRDADAVDT